MPELLCEACGNAPAKRDDILCNDCSYYYGILSELINDHPDFDVARLKGIYEWRAKKSLVKAK